MPTSSPPRVTSPWPVSQALSTTQVGVEAQAREVGDVDALAFAQHHRGRRGRDARDQAVGGEVHDPANALSRPSRVAQGPSRGGTPWWAATAIASARVPGSVASPVASGLPTPMLPWP